MPPYETVKVFDLADAPMNIRDCDQFAPLRPNHENEEPAILTLKVGLFDTPKEGPPEDCLSREITLSEYNLHKWLREQGAGVGEKILLLWKEHVKW